MAIPSIERAKKLAEFEKADGYDIACVNCKQPLWHITNLEKYGTRWTSTKISYDGVPSYSDYWEKDQKTPKRLDCPFCHEHYGKATQVKLEDDSLVTIFVPYSPQLEGL